MSIRSKLGIGLATCLAASVGTAIAQEAGETGAAVPIAAAEPASAPPLAENQSTVAGSPLDTIPVDAEPQPSSTPGREKSNSRLIEEIIVTSQKREENLKDVPISVQAFSADFLDAKAVVNQGDLPKITPGLTVSNPVGFTTIFMRGIGSDAFILADPVVVTYIDDVYFPNASSQLLDFGSVEQIEVLKGPQGTLFGRNALGGAIRVKTKDPSLTQFEASTDLGYATYSAFSSRASVSVPLLDSLAVSVAGAYNSEDNFLNGTYGPDNRKLPGFEAKSYRAKIYYKPTDWLDVHLNVFDFKEDSANRNIAFNVQPSILLGGPQLAAQDPRKGSINELTFAGSKGTTYYGRIDAKTPFFDARLLGSTQKVDVPKSFDFDATNLPVAFFSGRPIFSDSDTAEFQLVSNKESAYSEWFEWIVGVYYFQARQGITPANFRALGTDLSESQIGGVQIPQAFADALTRVTGGLPLPDGINLDLSGISGTKSIAYFTQETVKFTDWLSLTAGLRYQNEERTLIESTSGLRNADGSVTYIQQYRASEDPSLRDRSKQADPKVSISVRPPSFGFLGDAPLLYASYQTATTSLIYNIINIYDRPEKVKSSKIKAYEVGYKTFFLDGLVNLNAAVFDYNLKNSQAQVVSLQSGGAVRFENIPEIGIKGAEFDAVIQLFPELTGNGLVMTAAATYLDSKYIDADGVSSFDEVTGIYSQNKDFTGNRVVQTPKLTTSVGLTQTFQLTNGSIEAGIDYYRNSGYYFYAQNTDNSKVRKYDTVGANLGYFYEPWKLRATVYGQNLFNEDYLNAIFLNDFGADAFPAKLRVVGMRLAWNF